MRLVLSEGDEGSRSVLWLLHPNRGGSLDQKGQEPISDPVAARIGAAPEFGPGEGGIVLDTVDVVVGGQHCLG